MKALAIFAAITAASLTPAYSQGEPIDLNMINAITDEGFQRSEVMETASYLSDVIGPRLTNSPGMRRAAQWTLDEFNAYGLKNTRFEKFHFGRGWSFDTVTVHMTEPRRTQVHAMPISWHPGTQGPVDAEVLFAPMSDESDFEKFKGKLRGKIVLISSPRTQDEPSQPIFTRLNDEQLQDQLKFNIPGQPSKGPGGFEDFLVFSEKLARFLDEEGALLMVKRSSRDAGLLNAVGYLHRSDYTPATPAIVVASEDYDRMARLAGRGEIIRMEVEVGARFHDDDPDGQNVIAEIPGRGARPEIVIAGAHLDSWFMGDGAVDNGAGVAVVMEAARILSALNVKPKRTIRFALWDGEEQGLFGALHHVETHFASKPALADESRKNVLRYFAVNDTWPVRPERDYERFSGYFNLDNGSGRIRGIYGEGNMALQPIFERWFEPFHEFGAETVALNGTGGSDHDAFTAMGLPGFQFIQDPLDYGSRLHHTEIDTASHVYEKDLKQAAVIMASVLWHAANRDERLPRKPMPTRPNYPEKKPDVE